MALATPLLLLLVLPGSPLRLSDDGAIQLLGLVFGALTILALGVYDDLRGARAWEKLTVQCVVAISAWTMGVRIGSFAGPGGEALWLAPWASFLVTVTWIVLVTNAVNLIDGLDGLAAGVCLIAVATLLVFGLVDGQLLLCIAAAALAGALVGFLFFNFNPATIFMGDSGSLLLGFLLAVVSIASTAKQLTAWAFFLPVLALAVPLSDTLYAVVRRVSAGRPVTQADQDHVHHRLIKAGLSHRQSVLALYGVAMAIAGGALALKAGQDPRQAILIVLAGVAVASSLQLFGFPRRLREQLAHPGRGGRELIDPSIRRALHRNIRAAGSADEAWRATRAALSPLRVHEATMELFTRNPATWHFRDPSDAPPRRLRSREVHVDVPLVAERNCFGALNLIWLRDSDPMVDREREIQVHLVADAVTDALERSLGPELERQLVVTRLPAR